MKTAALVLAAVVFASLAVACGGDSDNTALTADEAKDLAAMVESLQGEAGFRPMIPEYVPPKIDRVPIGQVLGTSVSPEISLAYDFHLDASSEVITPKDPFLAVMTLAEWRKKTSCGDIGGPTEPDALVDTVIVVGESSVREVILKIADDTMSHKLVFTVGELCVNSFFHWAFPQGTPAQLPEEMRREGVRVVQSILEN